MKRFIPFILIACKGNTISDSGVISSPFDSGVKTLSLDECVAKCEEQTYCREVQQYTTERECVEDQGNTYCREPKMPGKLSCKQLYGRTSEEDKARAKKDAIVLCKTFPWNAFVKGADETACNACTNTCSVKVGIQSK